MNYNLAQNLHIPIYLFKKLNKSNVIVLYTLQGLNVQVKNYIETQSIAMVVETTWSFLVGKRVWALNP